MMKQGFMVDLLDLNHLEVVFTCATVGASPIHWHIFPFGTRGNIVFWATSSFVVNKRTNQAHIFFHQRQSRQSGLEFNVTDFKLILGSFHL